MAKSKKQPTPDNPPALPAKVADLTPNPENPRTITAEALGGLKYSMDQFGDLNCVVFCVRSGQLVCGHQRTSQMPPGAEIVNIRQEADPTGQVARGEIVIDGTAWVVRFVDWDANKEMAANISGNSTKISGSFTDAIFSMLDKLEIELPELSSGLLLDELRIELNDALDTGATGKGDFGDDPGPTEPPVVPVSKAGEIYELGLSVACPKCGKLNHVKVNS